MLVKAVASKLTQLSWCPSRPIILIICECLPKTNHMLTSIGSETSFTGCQLDWLLPVVLCTGSLYSLLARQDISHKLCNCCIAGGRGCIDFNRLEWKALAYLHKDMNTVGNMIHVALAVMYQKYSTYCLKGCQGCAYQWDRYNYDLWLQASVHAYNMGRSAEILEQRTFRFCKKKER